MPDDELPDRGDEVLAEQRDLEERLGRSGLPDAENFISAANELLALYQTTIREVRAQGADAVDISELNNRADSYHDGLKLAFLNLAGENDDANEYVRFMDGRLNANELMLNAMIETPAEPGTPEAVDEPAEAPVEQRPAIVPDAEPRIEPLPSPGESLEDTVRNYLTLLHTAGVSREDAVNQADTYFIENGMPHIRENIVAAAQELYEAAPTPEHAPPEEAEESYEELPQLSRQPEEAEESTEPTIILTDEEPEIELTDEEEEEPAAEVPAPEPVRQTPAQRISLMLEASEQAYENAQYDAAMDIAENAVRFSIGNNLYIPAVWQNLDSCAEKVPARRNVPAQYYNRERVRDLAQANAINANQAGDYESALDIVADIAIRDDRIGVFSTNVWNFVAGLYEEHSDADIEGEKWNALSGLAEKICNAKLERNEQCPENVLEYFLAFNPLSAELLTKNKIVKANKLFAQMEREFNRGHYADVSEIAAGEAMCDVYSFLTPEQHEKFGEYIKDQRVLSA
jgi:hypothetical protein